MDCYGACDDGNVAHDVRAWCIENGTNDNYRIALCGYEGEGHDGLIEAGWSVFEWKTQGGMGNQGNATGRDNKKRERIWFSPACIQKQEDRQMGML